MALWCSSASDPSTGSASGVCPSSLHSRITTAGIVISTVLAFVFLGGLGRVIQDHGTTRVLCLALLGAVAQGIAVLGLVIARQSSDRSYLPGTDPRPVWVHADSTRLVWEQAGKRGTLWVDQLTPTVFRERTVAVRWQAPSAVRTPVSSSGTGSGSRIPAIFAPEAN